MAKVWPRSHACELELLNREKSKAEMPASLILLLFAANLGTRDELPKFSSGRRVRPPACIARPVSGRRTLSPFGDPPSFKVTKLTPKR